MLLPAIYCQRYVRGKCPKGTPSAKERIHEESRILSKFFPPSLPSSSIHRRLKKICITILYIGDIDHQSVKNGSTIHLLVLYIYIYKSWGRKSMYVQWERIWTNSRKNEKELMVDLGNERVWRERKSEGARAKEFEEPACTRERIGGIAKGRSKARFSLPPTLRRKRRGRRPPRFSKPRSRGSQKPMSARSR